MGAHTYSIPTHLMALRGCCTQNTFDNKKKKKLAAELSEIFFYSCGSLLEQICLNHDSLDSSNGEQREKRA